MASWPSAGKIGGGSAATSSQSSMAGSMAGGSTFVSWITSREGLRQVYDGMVS